MMEAEAKFRALLIRISKLFSRTNVEELAFITSKDINDKQLSEESEESGNALKLFQAMCDRGLYTHDNPSLLLQHLKDIGRSDAVRVLQQEMGASSPYNHSADEHVLLSRNQETALGHVPTVKIACVSDHLYPRLLLEKDQQVSLPLGRTPAPTASTSQPNEDFKDRVGYPGTAFPCSHECAAGTKTLEPEASLRGDANSPRFPDIPERPNQRDSRDNKGSSGTYFKFPVPERPSRRPDIANFGVQELELRRLSRCFSAGKVDDLGLELGFGDGRISQLKYENPHDISRVFYRLMVEWRSAQHGGSNMRENLANHLRNIDCMGLAGDLEMGRFS